MIRNDVKTRQIATFFIAFLPMVKILSAPAAFSAFCGEKLWQPALLLFLIDFLLIFLFMFYAKKREYLPFFDILTQDYSKTFAQIVFFIYGVFFLLRAFVPLCEYKYLVETGFYEVMPRSEIFFPVFALTFYMAIKGLKVLGRCSEIAAPITVIGMLIIFYLTFGSGDFSNLLPLFYGSGVKEINCAVKNTFWFNDAVYLILFCGHFKNDKKMTLKISVCYAISAALTLFFYLCFYSVFYTVAPIEKTAISSVSIFSVTLINVGRFDYLALFILTISGVFAISVPVLASVKCFGRAFQTRKTVIPSIVVNLALFISVAVFSEKLDAIVSFYQEKLFPFFIFCGYFLPFLGLKGCINKKQIIALEKQNRKFKGKTIHEL